MIFPLDGTRREIARSVEVLPAPFAPSSAVAPCSAVARSRPSTATVVP
jgi:hypothetical protein